MKNQTLSQIKHNIFQSLFTVLTMKTFEIYTLTFSTIIQADTILQAIEKFHNMYEDTMLICMQVDTDFHKKWLTMPEFNVPLIF